MDSARTSFPPDEWWRSERFRYPAQQSTNHLAAGVYGDNFDIVVISVRYPISPPRRKGSMTAGLCFFADWINDGNVGVPIVQDQIVVALCGTAGFDILYLYGLKNDGSDCVVCRPAHGQADGKITATYHGNNLVAITNGKRAPWPRYAYQWTGDDWIQSVRVDSDAPLVPVPRLWNQAQLIALRSRGDRLRVIRPESPHPPTGSRPV